MKPGVTYRSPASITVFAVALPSDPMARMRSPRNADVGAIPGIAGAIEHAAVARSGCRTVAASGARKIVRSAQRSQRQSRSNAHVAHSDSGRTYRMYSPPKPSALVERAGAGVGDERAQRQSIRAARRAPMLASGRAAPSRRPCPRPASVDRKHRQMRVRALVEVIDERHQIRAAGRPAVELGDRASLRPRLDGSSNHASSARRSPSISSGFVAMRGRVETVDQPLGEIEDELAIASSAVELTPTGDSTADRQL